MFTVILYHGSIWYLIPPHLNFLSVNHTRHFPAFLPIAISPRYLDQRNRLISHIPWHNPTIHPAISATPTLSQANIIHVPPFHNLCPVSQSVYAPQQARLCTSYRPMERPGITSALTRRRRPEEARRPSGSNRSGRRRRKNYSSRGKDAIAARAGAAR